MMLPAIPSSNTPAVVMRREGLTQEDYVALKGAMPHYKYLLLVKLLRATGLREAELLRLHPEHIQRQGPDVLLLVRRGKQQGLVHWEQVPLHPELAQELIAYVVGNQLKSGLPVFPFHPRSFQRAFVEAARKALGRYARPHDLRHLYVKHLVTKQGYPIEVASVMVGHKDTKTTLQWYFDLNLEERRNVNKSVPV